MLLRLPRSAAALFAGGDVADGAIEIAVFTVALVSAHAVDDLGHFAG